MRTILCTGDSHTWGQGADGLLESFSPSVVGGELRLASFESNCYVNVLRRMVYKSTNSFVKELDASAISIMSGLTKHKCFVCIGDKPLSLSAEVNLIRIQFYAYEKPYTASILLDGECAETLQMAATHNENAYKNIVVYGDGTKEQNLTVRADTGTALIYRIELYQGEYAVINSGIGSCPTLRYMSDYWEDYVTALHPFVVVMEPHTINDWLMLDPPTDYYQRVIEMIKKFKALGSKIIMLTVSPIIGNQINKSGFDYSLYIEQSRRAAENCNIPICDTNILMKQKIDGLSSEEGRKLLFSDNWHVNNLGHKIYAEEAFCYLQTII